MAAHVYHYCQSCKHCISPSMHADVFKAQQAEIATGLALLGMRPWIVSTGHHVWTYQCPKCGQDWPYKVLRIGRAPLARLERVTRVVAELLPAPKRRKVQLYSGGQNYKKLQQRKCVQYNPVLGHNRSIWSRRGSHRVYGQ